MQQRSEETRANILSASQQLFAQHGYDATGVAEICEAAGVSKGAFYHHFHSKQAVFMALLEGWLREFDTQLGTIGQTALDIPSALMTMTSMTQHVFQAADGRLPMFLEFWTQSSRDPEVWQTTIAPYRRFHHLFSDLVRKGIAEGTLKSVDSEIAARVILAMAVGVLFQGLLDPQAAQWDQVARAGMEHLMHGMMLEPEG